MCAFVEMFTRRWSNLQLRSWSGRRRRSNDPQASPVCLRRLLRVLTQCSCEGKLWCGELGEHPPRGCHGTLLRSFLCSYPSAWLQSLYDARCGFSPSPKVQVQQFDVDLMVPSSELSLCKWLPLQHKHRRGCL